MAEGFDEYIKLVEIYMLLYGGEFWHILNLTGEGSSLFCMRKAKNKPYLSLSMSCRHWTILTLPFCRIEGDTASELNPRE